MMNKCFICKKALSIPESYYCLCDAKICNDCIETVMINERQWKCPNCGEINDIGESKLFRNKTE
jgi:hypothetical protein